MLVWRKVIRDVFFPQLSDRTLGILRDWIARDDERLMQGGLVSPPALPTCHDWPVERTCLAGLAAVVEYTGSDNLEDVTVNQLVGHFLRLSGAMNEGTKASDSIVPEYPSQVVLNWFDMKERPEAFRLLLAELDRELARRAPARKEVLLLPH
jgi:hypothetical protein